jgi:hypothetical protein
MSESISMTDEEFMAFINANKERMNTLMGDDKDVKAFIKDSAKKAKDKIEKTEDAFEHTVKGVFEAIFSPEVQKHVIGAGVEIILGISAALKAMPVPEKAQPIVDKMVEVRQNASSVYCAKNPECPRKKSSEPAEGKKIEID